MIRAVFFAFFCVVYAPAWAADYYVSMGGSDSNSGLTVALAFATVNKCSATMIAGDTCHVQLGTYTDNHVCSLPDYTSSGFVCQGTSGTAAKPITFVSDVPLAAKLRCPSDEGMFPLDASYIVIQGFDMSCPGTAGAYGFAGVTYGNNGHNTFKNNYLHDFATSACPGTGVIAGSDTSFATQTNQGFNTYDGNVIRHSGANTSTPAGSTGTQCGTYHGIYEGAKNARFTNNIISGITGFGLSVYGGGVCHDVIANNTVFDNSNGGIIVEDITGDSLHLDQCGNGGATDFNVVINNIVANNGYGQDFSGASYNGQAGGISLYSFLSMIGNNNVVSNNIVFGNNPNNVASPGVPDYFILGPVAPTQMLPGSNATAFKNYQSDKNWAPAANYNPLNYASPQLSSAINGGTTEPSTNGGNIILLQSLGSTSPSWNGFNLRQVFYTTNLKNAVAGATLVRVTLKFTDVGGSVDSAWICESGGTNEYDCGSAPTQLTFGGSASIPSTTAQNYVSDAVPFTYTGTGTKLVVSAHFTGVVSLAYSSSTGNAPYYLLGADNGSVANPTGFTAEGAGYQMMTINVEMMVPGFSYTPIPRDFLGISRSQKVIPDVGAFEYIFPCQDDPYC